MRKVFISYRHMEPDLGLAAEIENNLSRRGASVFRDARIKIGDDWVETIERELASSRFLIVLVSQASMGNRHVREEIVRAHKLGLQILPLRVDATEMPYDIASILGTLQTRNVSHGGVASICEEILELINSEEESCESEEESCEAGNLPHLQPETGTVSLDSPFYVRRTVDDQIEQRLRGRGTTVLLRGARQVGKSSLLVRAAAKAQTAGRQVSRIDFQLMDNEQRQSLRALLRHLAFSLAADLNLGHEPDEFWDDRVGSKASMTRFVEHAILKSTSSPVVLCLDEVDTAFGTAYCDDFFSMLRVWHNQRATSSAWSRLHLVITHSTDPALWITDLRQSPFNVGEPHHLTDFTDDQVRDLCRRYAIAANTEELMRFFGGHPFLIRKALFTMRTTACSATDLMLDIFSDGSPFREHLQLLLGPLLANSALSAAMRQVLKTGTCDNERGYQGLLGAGLVKGHSRGRVVPRCELYSAFFERHV